MSRVIAILALLLCAAHSQARTLYVSLTGSHDTNAPAFGTLATAATNIQAAIDAAGDGDTIILAQGEYAGGAVFNLKRDITMRSVYGTLWDADKTIVRNTGQAYNLHLYNSTNITLSGLSFVGSVYAIMLGKTGNLSPATGITVDSCVVRESTASNYGNVYVAASASSLALKNSIVVGNAGHGVERYDGTVIVESCVVEANRTYQLYGGISVKNSIYGNAQGAITSLGGNVTNNTTNSVMRLLDIAPASEGVGTNLVWAGVASYMPRLGSLAQGAGVAYTGIEDAKSGDGGPVLVPAGAKFLGRDSSTNANHGGAIGGVTASTNSPFAGGGSAAFDGASGGINAAPGNSAAITLEAWFRTTAASPNNDIGHRVVTIYRDKSFRSKFAIMLRNNTPRLLWVKSSPVAVDGLDAPSTANDGAWHHIAGTTDGTEFRLYVDGVCVATNLSSNLSSDYVGQGIGWNGGNGGYFDGEIADARAWNIARTPAEIAASYTNRLAGTEAGLIGYWRLDERDTPITTGPFNLRNPLNHPTYMEAF